MTVRQKTRCTRARFSNSFQSQKFSPRVHGNYPGSAGEINVRRINRFIGQRQRGCDRPFVPRRRRDVLCNPVIFAAKRRSERRYLRKTEGGAAGAVRDARRNDEERGESENRAPDISERGDGIGRS